MNLIIINVPIRTVRNNILQEPITTLDYTINLEPAKISDYYHSIQLPSKTIILNKASDLLRMEWEDKEFNLLFNQKKLKKEYDNMRINKKINTGLIKKHEVITEVLEKTPIHFDRDSIKQSQWLIQLNKTIKEYETVIPQNLIDEYIKVKKSLERITGITTKHDIAKIKKGFSANNKKISHSLRIKHWPDKSKYEFNEQSFYTLGQLAKLNLKLEELWNR